ncbi:MAG: TIGR00730 family Rossman fold protein [Planctomycetota bacterium]
MSVEFEYGHDFRQEEPWRIFRIMAEFVEGTEETARIHPAVSIFGSARILPGTPYYNQAELLARKLADSGYNIITGGGPGIMEAANKGAKESGSGRSVGLNIELPAEQVANPFVEKLITFRYFFIRKVMFIKSSCAVVVLPGGFGTLDEFFESVTLIQTHKIPPRPVYLMGREFWGGLIGWARTVVLAQKHIDPEDLDIFTLTDDIDEVVEGIRKRCPLAQCPANPFQEGL